MNWFYDLTFEQLQETLKTLGLKPYVAGQTWRWIYVRNERNISAWSDISKKNREILSDALDVSLNEITHEQADIYGTRKFLFKLRDGKFIESVFMTEKKHFTFCISSQAGCPLGCRFCATGTMGFIRNLTAGEIISQALSLKNAPPPATPTEDDPWRGKINLVFMGMGEPLLNYTNLKQALTIITDPQGMAISPRNITISTAGLLEPLKQLEADFPNIKISFSLNASDSRLREELMPISRKEKLETFLDHFTRTGRKRRTRVTMEYVMIRNITDRSEDAARLVRMLRGFPCKINLIPFNPVSHADYESPSPESVEQFADYLHQKGFTVIVRWSKGRGIQSACGQLATTQIPPVNSVNNV